jgi:Ca2+-transporting ATPase
MGFIFAVHVPIGGLALLPLILGLPIVLTPIHIAFLEMVIDPVCSLVFEAETEEDDIMGRPPRDPEAPLFSGPLIAWGLLQGIVAFAFVAAIFLSASWRGMSETEVRALAFFSLVLTIVSLIFVNRSFGASLVAAFARPIWRWYSSYSWWSVFSDSRCSGPLCVIFSDLGLYTATIWRSRWRRVPAR